MCETFRLSVFTLLVLAVPALSSPVWSAWQPLIGIPNPPFGIHEQPPARPAQWPSREATNHYYIDNTHPAATDGGNPFGYPERPRVDLPSHLTAGAYVEIRGGPYRGRQWIITADGTADRSVWIRGGGATRPVIQRETILKGRYVILDSLHYTSTLSPRFHNGETVRYAAIRNCEFAGPGVSAGHHAVIGIGGRPNAVASHIVIYNNVIRDYGDASPSAPENDFHGIAPHAFATDVWILNNRVHNMGGDGVQVGVAKIPAEARPQRIYIGANTFSDNRENAVDIKAANDVIVAHNTMRGAVRTSSSAGEVVVIHDRPDHVWVLFNRIHDGEIGVITTGSTNTYVIGNLIYNIHGTQQATPSNAAIGFRGGASLIAVNNTIWNVDTGIQVSKGQNAILLANNIIANTPAHLYHVHIDGAAAAAGARAQHNLLFQAGAQPRLHWGNASPNAKDVCVECVYADPRFVDVEAADFRLQPGSPAIDAAGASPAYDDFYRRYSLRIDRDVSGLARPQGLRWDVGAYEADRELVAPPTSTPAKAQTTW